MVIIPETNAQTLFEQIGGMRTVNAATEIFYKKVMDDCLINHFFEKVDKEEQTERMKAFLAYVFGGPMAYNGKDLFGIHLNMSLTVGHFASVIGHLITTLEELNLEEELVEDVVTIAFSVKDDLLR